MSAFGWLTTHSLDNRRVHPTFANVRVIPTSVGIHTKAIYLNSRLHGNNRSTKLQNEVFAISGCTPTGSVLPD
jgi:hypothetical protein